MITRKIDDQVRKIPDKVALKKGNQSITYQHFKDLSDHLSHIIEGNSPPNEETVVALMMGHDPGMVIGMIGVLKSGNIYVPLDPLFPIKRLEYLLIESGTKVLVTNNEHKEFASTLKERVKGIQTVINIDNRSHDNSKEKPEIQVNPQKTGYILYTSGSTGNPKGVLQNSENIEYFTENWIRIFSITENDRLTLLSSFGHDGSIPDVYSALLSGATLFLFDVKRGTNIADQLGWIEKEKITLWHSVPTLYRYFINTITGDEDLSLIRLVALGGEEIRVQDLRKFREYFPHATFFNVYGQTESTINSIWEAPGDSIRNIPIGEPIPGTEMFVVNDEGYEADPLVTGEIIVCSKHLALGYWKDPGETRRKFIDDPESGRAYWTGDLGRLLLDGGIEIVGRKDHQVKIRGYRIELGEIESRLLEKLEIKEAVLISSDMLAGNKNRNKEESFLVGYFVAEREIGNTELREFLSVSLPDYMIPASFVQMEKMPLTQSRKIDKKALPEPEIGRGQSYRAPRNSIEEALLKMWSDILKLEGEKIGIEGNFFELGGHSLKATEFVSRAHKELQIKIPLVEVFKSPTIAKLSQYVKGANSDTHHSVRSSEEKEYYKLSSAQKRIYVLQQMEPESTSYNMPLVFRLEEEPNVVRLEETFLKLLLRHEGLRTSFILENDEPVQKIHDRFDFSITNPDQVLSIEADISEEQGKKILKDFVHPFDLTVAPLVRVGLIPVKKESYLFIIDVHHIISDRISHNLLEKDFLSLYRGKDLPPLKLQYKDYSEWQIKKRFQENGKNLLEQQEAFWLTQYWEPVPQLTLPLDFKRPLFQDFRGERFGFYVCEEETAEIKKLAIDEGVTVHMVMSAIFVFLLARVSGQEDIVVGTPIAGRKHNDLNGIIGLFINTLALRYFPKKQKTFRDFLKEVRDMSLKAYENQEYPFEDLVKKVVIQRDMSRNPLFDVLFEVRTGGQEDPEEEKDSLQELKLKPYQMENTTTKVDMDWLGVELKAQFYFKVAYSTSLYRKETIELMTSQFQTLIRNVVVNSGNRLEDIDYRTQVEREMSDIQEMEFNF
jgi:amino acid adenylation domain-containing protein